MSHKNKLSLIGQVNAELGKLLAAGVGRSKHQDKKTGETQGKIYSYGTFRAYLKQCCYFVKWCKAEHGCKTLQDCRGYVNKYLQSAIDKGLSPYTIKLYAAALAKLYGCTTADFVQTPPRMRKGIQRSRSKAARDHHFSESRNGDLVLFCRCTGLRRRELATVRGSCLKVKQNKYYVIVYNGKGGKVREVPIIGDVRRVVELMKSAGAGKVFDSIPGAADIHGYRREYAQRYYAMISRPLNTLTHVQKYYCKGDKRGVVYDRRAMYEVSRALGHNRVNVIAEHYL